MTELPSIPAFSWHPFTPRGIAAAASAPRWQLWLALGVTGTLSILALIWFLSTAWWPVISGAVANLPEGGLIRGGVLHPGTASTHVRLGENRFLSIALEWVEIGPRDQASDVRIELRLDHALACSLFGCVALDYRAVGDRPVGRTETGAWWRAWSPFLMAAAALGHATFLVIAWWGLAILTGWGVRLLGYYLEREITFVGAVRVAQAGLIPGALWLTAAVFFYGRGWLNLYGLLVVFVMHVPVGWIYAAAACRHLPRRPDHPSLNPFQSEDEPKPEESANPFSGPAE